ncbi:MAG: hypothetical protein P8Y45_15270 [Exilibacterium sp.]
MNDEYPNKALRKFHTALEGIAVEKILQIQGKWALERKPPFGLLTCKSSLILGMRLPKFLAPYGTQEQCFNALMWGGSLYLLRLE